MSDIPLSKYLLHEPLGKGGYGTVYRATDTVLEVERAVKVLHPALAADMDFITRFRQEARLAAKLEHPHLVPVYDLGEEQGRYFQAMKYMPAGSLKEVLATSPLPFPLALTVLEQIAAALDFIHTRPEPLIHRDIKPGNILFETDPRTGPVQARLGDLGFAKALTSASSVSMSATGGMIGTPAYMAPEVWRHGQAIGPAADIYALGCVFYEMLTGNVLFPGDSPPEVMTMHVLEGPKFPSVWPEGVPGGVEEVLKKALAQKGEQRFERAGRFVASVKKKQLGPIMELENSEDYKKTEENSLVEQTKRKIQDEIPLQQVKKRGFGVPKWGWTALGALIISIMVIGIFLRGTKANLAFFVSPTSHSSLVVPSSTFVANNVATLTVTPIHTSLGPTLTNSPSPAQTLIPTAAPLSIFTNPYAGPIPEGAIARLGKGKINDIALSPDGKFLAVGTSIGVWLYDANSLLLIDYLEYINYVEDVAWSPDSKKVALIWGEDLSSLLIWTISMYQTVQLLEGADLERFHFVAFSPNGQIVATQSSGEVFLWDVDNGEHIRTLEYSCAYCEPAGVTFSPDGTILAIGATDQTILWDMSTGERLNTILGIYAAFSPDGNTLSNVRNDNILLWNVSDGARIRTLEGNASYYGNLSFSSDGQTLASITNDDTIVLWDVNTGEILHTLTDVDRATHVLFSAEGSHLISSSSSGMIVWDVATGNRLQILEGHGVLGEEFFFSHDGNAVFGYLGGNAILWDVNLFQPIRTLSNVGQYISPDGTTLLGAKYGEVFLWDAMTGELLHTLKGYSNIFAFYHLAYSPNGKMVAGTDNENNTVFLWSVETGLQLHTFKIHPGNGSSLAFSPDGLILASGESSGTVILWNIENGEEIQILKTNSFSPSSLAFSPDGQILAGGLLNDKNASDAGSVMLWNLDTGVLIQNLEGHSAGVNTVVFSPDGSILASGSVDNTVILWDVETGKQLRILEGHVDDVTSVTFSPDGKILASGSQDGTVILWNINP